MLVFFSVTISSRNRNWISCYTETMPGKLPSFIQTSKYYWLDHIEEEEGLTDYLKLSEAKVIRRERKVIFCTHHEN